MERVSKATFIAISNRKIEMYDAFVKTIDILVPIVKEWDGKKLTKRFIDKVNNIIKDKVPYIRVGFDTSWRGERDNRFKFYYDNRYVNSVSAYVNYPETTVYAYNGNDYINRDDFRLNAINCIQSLEREKEICRESKENLQVSIEQIDDVIAMYSEMKACVERTMAEIPSPLKTRIDITCPVYE